MTEDVAYSIGCNQRGANGLDDFELHFCIAMPIANRLTDLRMGTGQALVAVCAAHDLCGWIRLPEPRLVAAIPLRELARVVDLDADGVLVEARALSPLAAAGVPADGVKGQKLSHDTVATDDQVGRDLALLVAEGVNGRLGVGTSRIVDDDGVGQPRGKGAALVGRFDVVDAFEAVIRGLFP